MWAMSNYCQREHHFHHSCKPNLKVKVKNEDENIKKAPQN